MKNSIQELKTNELQHVHGGHENGTPHFHWHEIIVIAAATFVTAWMWISSCFRRASKPQQ